MGDAKECATVLLTRDPDELQRMVHELRGHWAKATEQAERAERERDEARAAGLGACKELDVIVTERDTARRQLAVAREALEGIDFGRVREDGYCMACEEMDSEDPCIHRLAHDTLKKIASLTDGVQPPARPICEPCGEYKDQCRCYEIQPPTPALTVEDVLAVECPRHGPGYCHTHDRHGYYCEARLRAALETRR